MSNSLISDQIGNLLFSNQAVLESVTEYLFNLSVFDLAVTIWFNNW